ncbi:AhpC/TSA family protein [Bacteroidales bacterium]|nr:AhpC/TSA family protein [Bacteroidales bacterium]
MKYLIPLLLIPLILSCGNKSNNFSITGKITNGKDYYVILNKLDIESSEIADSFKLNESGEYNFTGTIEQPTFYSLTNHLDGKIILCIYPGEKVILNSDYQKSNDFYEVYGSPDSERIAILTRKQNEMFSKLKLNFRMYQDSIRSENIEQLMLERNKKRSDIVAEHNRYTKQFISEAPGSMACIPALYQIVGPKTTVLDIKKDFQYFNMVDSALMKKFPESSAVQNLNRTVASFRLKQQKLGVGDKIPGFSLPSNNNDTLSLSDFNNKYLLINFWASWHTSSKTENQKVNNWSKQFNGDSLAVIQISLDRSKTDWLDAISKDSLQATQLSDLQMWNSPLVKSFNIEAIPLYYLTNPNGTIVAISQNADEIQDYLKDYLNEIQ